jgi:hypothetical protein
MVSLEYSSFSKPLASLSDTISMIGSPFESLKNAIDDVIKA